MRLQNIIIPQNKVDRIKDDATVTQHKQMKKFVAATVALGAPIIPISAVFKYNMDVAEETHDERDVGRSVCQSRV
ncbi:hypothetical protein KXD40_002209 [Peronospora effusa]|nr:hypothetical protein KXD40_002209 [Peronospora effusa]